MNLTLTIAHNIFLTKEERYNLYKGDTIELVGTSVPIWYYNTKTSEPGAEVFCKYKLIPTDDKTYVSYKKDGYEILLPKSFHITVDNVEKENPITIRNILDLKDGGIEWIAFRQFGKLVKNKNDINMIHFVEIKPIEELEASLS